MSRIQVITYVLVYTIVHFIYIDPMQCELRYSIDDVVILMIYVHLIPSSEERKGSGRYIGMNV